VSEPGEKTRVSGRYPLNSGVTRGMSWKVWCTKLYKHSISRSCCTYQMIGWPLIAWAKLEVVNIWQDIEEQSAVQPPKAAKICNSRKGSGKKGQAHLIQNVLVHHGSANYMRKLLLFTVSKTDAAQLHHITLTVEFYFPYARETDWMHAMCRGSLE